MEAKKFHKHKAKPADDFDDKDEVVPDADQDDVKNILMQIKHGISLLQAQDKDDTNFSLPIKFADRTVHNIGSEHIGNFLEKFMSAKPADREKMQDMAIRNLRGFKDALSFRLEPKLQSKIKGTRYMTHFAGDLDDK